MAVNIGDRLPENVFTNMMIEKATIIQDHLKCKQNVCPLIIVANIGYNTAVFKLYDTMKEDDSLKLQMTFSNMSDIDEQICILWQQVNFLLQEYCSLCKNQDGNAAANSNLINPYILLPNAWCLM